MNYKNEFKNIIKICKFAFPIIILLSPFLLLFYLKNINSHAFFIDLINDSYIFTILGIASIIIASSLLFIYILPSFLWFITKATSNYDFEKKQKIIRILKESDKKKDFKINKFNFILCVFVIPLITFQVILSEFNGLSLTIGLILSSVLVAFLILNYENKKHTFSKWKVCFIIIVSILAISYNYAFTNNRLQTQSIILIITLLIIVTYLFPDRFDKPNITTISNKISLFLISLFILQISLSFLLITIELTNITDNSLASNLKLIFFLTLLYVIPNSIILFSSKNNKLIFITAYALLLLTSTNIANLITYRTFVFIGISNANTQCLSINKWKKPEEPLIFQYKKIYGEFYIAYRGNNSVVLCEMKDKKQIIELEINNKDKKMDLYCIYAQNKYITKINSCPSNQHL